jgi:hypothetical protein
MDKLKSYNSLVISQKKEWGEILTGFETKNKYVVSDEAGNTVYYAAEEDGSILLRWFLKALRPFTVVVLTVSNQVILRVKRPFRFYFHQADVPEWVDVSWRRLKSCSANQDVRKSTFRCGGPMSMCLSFIRKLGMLLMML